MNENGVKGAAGQLGADVPQDGCRQASAAAAPVRKFLVPGTYDPITRGHIDVIERSCRLCDEVVVAVADSRDKRGGPAFTLDQRVAMAREALADMPQVTVLPFQGLLVEFARSLGGVTAVVKGLRAITDFEYEFQQAQLNYRMAPEIEAVFVMSGSDFGYVSSSAVREIAKHGGDVSFLVTPNVERALRVRYGYADA